MIGFGSAGEGACKVESWRRKISTQPLLQEKAKAQEDKK